MQAPRGTQVNNPNDSRRHYAAPSKSVYSSPHTRIMKTKMAREHKKGPLIGSESPFFPAEEHYGLVGLWKPILRNQVKPDRHPLGGGLTSGSAGLPDQGRLFPARFGYPR